VSTFADLRARVSDALATYTTDPVFDAPVDSIEPPCYVLVWSAPWIVPLTMCSYTARLDVILVVGRIDPAPGFETIEAMLATTVTALRSAALPMVQAAPPGPFDVAGLTYLAARVTTESPLTLE
jgi:hypothetical protein